MVGIDKDSDRISSLSLGESSRGRAVITATVEATEEAILNALTGATTVVGRDGFQAEAISIPKLRSLLSTGAMTQR